MRYPAAAEVTYRAALRSLVAALRAELRAEFNTYGPFLLAPASDYRGDDDAPQPGASGWADLLAQLLLRVMDRLTGQVRATETVMRLAGLRAANTNLTEWRALVRQAYGVDVLRGEPWLADQMAAWEQANLALIQSVPQGVVDQIRQQVTQAVSQGTSLRTLKGIVSERLGVGDSRAELIARDQIAKLNADLTQRRQRAIGVTRYQWQTVGDERVRASHRAHDGKFFDWAKPPAGTGHPGHDVRCRCRASPVLPGMTEAELKLLNAAA
jgi:SPP1 gp7 family putative phage head morphogenesis protein